MYNSNSISLNSNFLKNHNSNKEILFENSDLTYEILTFADKQESKYLVSLAFHEEPLTIQISNQLRKVDFADFDVYIGFFLEEVCSNGLSVVARSKQTGKLVGVCYNMDYNFFDQKFFDFYADKNQIFHNLIGFLHSISDEVKKINTDLDKKGSVIDIGFLAVHTEFRGKRISNRLVELSVELIAKSGFDYIVSEATSIFTKKIMQSINFECIYSIDVRRWLFEGRCFYENMEEPHQEFTFWMKKLK